MGLIKPIVECLRFEVRWDNHGWSTWAKCTRSRSMAPMRTIHTVNRRQVGPFPLDIAPPLVTARPYKGRNCGSSGEA
jgi:hypothetical protein